ncbi:SH3 domain-containing protein [Thalassotalea piscium]
MALTFNIANRLFVLTFLTLISLSTIATESDPLFTNVTGITTAHLQPEYWVTRAEHSSQLVLSQAQIATLNQQQFASEVFLKDPLSYPELITAEQVKKVITEISKPSKAARYYNKDKPLTDVDYQGYFNNMGLTFPDDQVKVKFALVTRRSSLRTFPTLDRVFNEQMNTDIDRFQESAVFPGEALAVLHISKDKQWAFVQNYHYRAWLQIKDIAFASKQTIEAFINKSERLVVTGAKVVTAFNPNNKKTSELVLEMGVSLPLVPLKTLKTFQVNGQNPYTSYVVALPTRDNQGHLKIEHVLIPKNADVSIGYLPMTKANVIKQAFKFLGERYGWGHDFNGRDCTGFIGEVFKSFGLLLPRNSGQQGHSTLGINQFFDSSSSIKERYLVLKSLKIGDLIYLPGHVAMFLGYDDSNKPYIIHDVHGMTFTDPQGQVISGMLNGVSVTPLLPFRTYIETMYNIKRLN